MPTTRTILVDPDQPDPDVIAKAAGILRAGGLVAFATETVYGLGADATNPEAVARIFEAKGRPATNPLIVHVQDKTAALDCVAEWPDRAEILANRFWPGPLTLVLPRSIIIPDIVTAGQDTVGVRVPRPGVARRLILETSRPIAAPSANRSNRLSPTQAKHVLKDLDGRVDLILDSGPTTVGIESTVLDLTTIRPRVLRPGRVTAEKIAEVLGEPVEHPGSRPDLAGPARSPGQLAVHYAPRTPAYRLDRDQIPSDPIDGRYTTVVFGPSLPASDRHWNLSKWTSNAVHSEATFYGALHELDGRGYDFILIIPPPDEPRWQAIRDRIWRATKPWPS
jgi:L-threonylcarbamoyladenylate synthase